jgi:hypothetical protein
MLRLIILLLPCVLAACSGGPQAWGITGPGQSPLPTATPNAAASPVPDASPEPGTPNTGTAYGPNNGPTSGSGNFYGYN